MYTKIMSLDGQQRLMFFARFDIQVGQELTYNYRWALLVPPAGTAGTACRHCILGTGAAPEVLAELVGGAWRPVGLASAMGRQGRQGDVGAGLGCNASPQPGRWVACFLRAG